MCIINSIKLYSCVNFNKQKSIDFILLALNLMCGAAPLHRTQLNQNDEEKIFVLCKALWRGDEEEFMWFSRRCCARIFIEKSMLESLLQKCENSFLNVMCAAQTKHPRTQTHIELSKYRAHSNMLR